MTPIQICQITIYSLIAISGLWLLYLEFTQPPVGY